MRVRVLFLICLFLGSSLTGFAQKENVTDKVNKALAQFDAAIKPDKSKRTSIGTIFTEFYREQEKLRNDIQGPSSGLAQGLQQDYQSVRKKSEALFTKRDTQLQKLLTSDEYKKWKSDIEPSIKSTRGKK